MMSSSTLTYSRYNRSPQSYQTRIRPQAPAADATQTKAPARRRSLLGPDKSVTVEKETLQELADRLNHRLNPEGRSLQFKVEAPRQGAQIVLMDGNQVVNSFDGSQSELLESYLHDMAGMHVSYVA